jgi:uncharacterized repeat protein (TIGR01451 family)
MAVQGQQQLAVRYPLGRWLLIMVLLIAGTVALFGNARAVSPTSSPLPEDSAALPDGASQDWWAGVRQQIGQSEYNLSGQEGQASYQAPNRAHNLRTYFTPAGIRLIPRTEANPGWELDITLASYGYAGNLQTPPAATLVVNANKIEYQRQTVTEWYLNDKRGLEQGFSLTEPPPAAGQGSPLLLELALGGNLTPNLVENGTAIEWTTAGGVRVLRYADLYAFDASGRALPARMQLIDSTVIRLMVDDRQAIYPITIDPLATSPSWSAESDQDGAEFGVSASTAGDLNGDGYAEVVVGSHRYDNGQADEGRVFIYNGSPTGLSLTADRTLESDQAEAWFGHSTATAGDVNGDGYGDLLVGAPLYDDGETNEGRAYVFYGSAIGVTPAISWTVESDQADAGLGGFADTAGDVNGDGYADVLIAADTYDNGEFNEGVAFVYHGSAAGLSLTPDWMGEGNQESADYGYKVSTAGDVNGDGYNDVIVGARFYDNGEDDEGAAFVYHGSAAGLSLAPDWMAESDQEFAYYGPVGTAGDVNGDGYTDVIVGAYGYENGEGDEGSAFAYYGSAAGLSLVPDWTAESDQSSAFFGIEVAPAGDVNGDGYADVLVGAFQYDNGESDEGAAFLYYGSADGLSLTAGWSAEGDHDSSRFGGSVDPAGDVNGDGYGDVIIGARLYDNGQFDEGRAFVYYGGPSGPSEEANWTADSDQSSAEFGVVTGAAGDVNGDGFADVVVGASGYDGGQLNEGAAFVFYGSDNGLDAVAAWMVESNQEDARLGEVSTAGDVNGDGYDDVLVAARNYDNGELDEGRAFVYHGSAAGLSTTPNWMAESDQAEARFGVATGTAGDVNGDGFADIIIGAYLYDAGETNEGRTFVYHGSAGGLSLTPDWTAESDQEGARMGTAATTAGDVNGDGYADVIVSADMYDDGQTNEGAAFVYHGSSTGLSLTADWTGESNQSEANVAYAGTAGDINGDGYADVVIGSPYYTNDAFQEGAVFVYFGSSSGLDTDWNWMAEGDQTQAYLGHSLTTTAGDVNGDGYADLLVAAPWYDNEEVDEGRAFLYLGTASGLGDTADWTGESNQALSQYGYGGGTAGDVNGDGFADIILGAFRYSNDQIEEGQVFVYYGNDSAGLSLRPRQMQPDGSTPIALLGRSDSATQVQLHLTGRTPFGRDQVKLEWQIAPLGTPFTATGVITGVSTVWTDVLTTGVALIQDVEGLTPDTPYHWRVRLHYEVGNRFGLSTGRWIHMPWNGGTEQDFRTFYATADLALTKTAAPSPVTIMTNLLYTLTVSNAGPQNATNVILTDSLPISTTITAISSSQGTCSEVANVVSCELGEIASGSQATVTITVNPLEAGRLFNYAWVTTTTVDPDPANNEAETVTTVQPARVYLPIIVR